MTMMRIPIMMMGSDDDGCIDGDDCINDNDVTNI